MNQLIKSLPGLVAWWPHTEGTGTTLNDYMGNQNGTITGFTWSKTTDGGYSINGNGSGDIVELGTDTWTTHNTGTFMCWIKLNTAGMGTSREIFYSGSKTNATAVFAFRVHTTNKLYKVFRTGTATLLGGNTANTALTAEVWYHVAMTCDGTTTKIYLNGVDDGFTLDFGTTTSARWLNDLVVSGIVHSIGGAYNGSTSPVNSMYGEMADSFYSTSVLTQQEIAQIYRKTYRS
jgi:hypothetical protein